MLGFCSLFEASGSYCDSLMPRGAAQAHRHQQHGGHQVQEVVAADVQLRLHRHAVGVDGQYRDGSAGGDVVVVGVEQRVAVAQRRAEAAVQRQVA